MIDPADVAHKLKGVLPRLDEDVVRARLSAAKQFVYLARRSRRTSSSPSTRSASPASTSRRASAGAIRRAGSRRRCWAGWTWTATASPGWSGIFDDRLREDPEPLRLSIDVRVQGVLRDELSKSIDEFTAIGGCGIVMDVRTGEVIAMVSLPDYDANKAARPRPRSASTAP